ncbi:MAG: hypothetical protein AAGA58_15305 [Verrucomicrobiota bacterium]
MEGTNLGKTRARQYLTHLFRFEKILYIFWFFFWFLNGLDKYFNGVFMKNDQWGKWYQGWFGVNRDEKFIHYFSRLDLPPWMAITSLHVFAIFEIIIGIAFLMMFFQKEPRSSFVRFAFKGGILLFVVFMIGDILFGDRMELWEHGTFLIITLITYQFYLTRFDEYVELIGEKHVGVADANQDGRISSEEYHQFMERVRAYGVEGRKPEPSGKEET